MTSILIAVVAGVAIGLCLGTLGAGGSILAVPVLVHLLGQAPVDAALAGQASIAVAEAKVITTEVALQASEKLFELAGSRATLAEFNLDRHWRNARTHTLHDPVRWKYHAIGNYVLNHVNPPRHGYL